MDSSNSGTPSSKEPIGARERRMAERKARQSSERERRKDRRRGGQPGHPGSGLSRDPDPDERKDADPSAQCSRYGTALDGTESVGTSWAQTWDEDRQARDGVAAAGAGLPVLRDRGHRARPARVAPGHELLRIEGEHGGAAERVRNVPAERGPHPLELLGQADRRHPGQADRCLPGQVRLHHLELGLVLAELTRNWVLCGRAAADPVR